MRINQLRRLPLRQAFSYLHTQLPQVTNLLLRRSLIAIAEAVPSLWKSSRHPFNASILSNLVVSKYSADRKMLRFAVFHDGSWFR